MQCFDVLKNFFAGKHRQEGDLTMKCLDMRLIVLLSIILQGAACSWNGTSVHNEHNANLYSIETKSDQSIVYRFTNGASCTKRADYTETMKSQGAIGVKQIFDARSLSE